MKKEFVVSIIVMFIAAFGFVACGSGGGGGGGHKAGIHTISLVNGQAADVVVGQADMYHGSANQGVSPSKYTVNAPFGNPAVAGGHLYIPDFSNNRVLGYKSIPTTNDAPADFVLGQTDFTTTSSVLSRASLLHPENIFSTGGKLLVMDTGNGRVLVYDSLPTTTGALPDVEVGQVDFDHSTSLCDKFTLSNPEGAFAVAGKLIVPDEGNNRVLIWNTIPTTNGVGADIVLGQADFTHCGINRGAGISSAAQDSLNDPEGAWSNGKKLIIADNGNKRILIWNTFPTTSDTLPDVVVGQANFTSNSGNAPAQDDFWAPTDLFSNGKQLFVADTGDNRVMVWNTIPTTNNAPADVVLGQADFTTASSGPIGPASLYDPSGVFVHGNQLFVTDSNDNRVLIFNGQ